tara:strand:- start:115 stop:375 length:261 start_codon:yes stop_codon:yes gene_type:complete
MLKHEHTSESEQIVVQDFLKRLVRDYSWIHLSLGVIGNVSFVVGSFTFLPRFSEYKTIGVWLFIVGASLMLIGALGQLLISVWRNK